MYVRQADSEVRCVLLCARAQQYDTDHSASDALTFNFQLQSVFLYDTVSGFAAFNATLLDEKRTPIFPPVTP